MNFGSKFCVILLKTVIPPLTHSDNYLFFFLLMLFTENYKHDNKGGAWVQDPHQAQGWLQLVSFPLKGI